MAMAKRLGLLTAIVAVCGLIPALPAAAAVPVSSALAPAAVASGLNPGQNAVQPTRSMTYDGGLLGGAARTHPTTEAFSSAAVGNVANHHDGDVDVVAGYTDGTIHIWSQRTGRQEFVVQTGGAIRSSPALIRLRAGGGLNVLVGTDNGDVFIYNFDTPQARTLFHKHVSVASGVNGFFGTPTVAALDNNGQMFVIATSFDQHLYVWDLTGKNKPGFPFWAQDTIWSSPTVAVVDGDPYPEIFFGYDCGGSPAQLCYQRNHATGGELTALQHNGKTAPGWPQFVAGQVVWSTPAVASLYGTSAKQIIVGTGLYYANAGYEFLVYDAHGKRIKAFPMRGRTFSSPAIGDIMGLGHPQIAIGTEFGYTDIVDPTTWRRLTHVCTAVLVTCATSHSSPIIGDLYNNGHQEAVAVGGNSFYIIDHTGQVTFTGQIPETALGLAASPTLANINGHATLFFTLMGGGPGGNHAEVVSFSFATAAGPSSWPAFKGDMGRSGSPTKKVPVPLI